MESFNVDEKQLWYFILQLPGWKYHNAFINVKFVKYKEFSVEFYI